MYRQDILYVKRNFPLPDVSTYCPFCHMIGEIHTYLSDFER